MIRLDELLTDDDLALDVLVPGKPDRPIRWVHATEQDDPTPHLRGGEVVLTDGLVFTGGVSARDYVRRLKEAGVAAVGYGLMEDRGPVPGELLDACVAERLCLFAVPIEVPFLAVSEAFVALHARERERELQASIRRNERLLAATQRGHGAAPVLEVVRADTGRRAWLAGPRGETLASTPGDEPSADDAAAVARAIARARAGRREPYEGWLVRTVTAFETSDTYLAVAADPPPTASDRAAIEQALPYLGLERAHARDLRASRRRFAAEAVGLVLSGETQDSVLHARLRAFELDPLAPMVAVVCEAQDRATALDALDGCLAREGMASIATIQSDQLVAIVQWPRPRRELPALGELLHDAVGGPAAVGVGSYAADATQLRTSLLNARHACDASGIGRGGAGHRAYDELGSHTVLLAAQDPNLLRTFTAAVLGAVHAHDREHGSELVSTLDCFIARNGRWQETAEALHVHVNTLRHRLARVEELTGRRMGDPADRVDIFLAFQAVRAITS